MPVSRKLAKSADFRSVAAAKMGIDPQYVFYLPKSRKKPVLAIWTEGWSEDEVQRVRALKPEIKAMAATVGAKIYMTPIHPHEQEARELVRRKSRGPKYRARKGLASGRRKSGAASRKKTDEQIAAASPAKRKQWQLANKFNGSLRKRRHTALVKKNGGFEFCAECKQKGPMTVDHVTALSNGGNNDLSNMQLLCKPCHRTKTQFEGSRIL
jgi:5-methylcytosine-specific restriction endonuclease McrA